MTNTAQLATRPTAEWTVEPPTLLSAARARSAPPSVALAHDYLSERGGAERVVVSLTHAFPSAPLYTSVYVPERFPELAKVDVRTSPLDHVPLIRRHHRLGLPLFPLAMRALEVEADVVVTDPPYEIALTGFGWDNTGVALGGASTKYEDYSIGFSKTISGYTISAKFIYPNVRREYLVKDGSFANTQRGVLSIATTF